MGYDGGDPQVSRGRLPSIAGSLSDQGSVYGDFIAAEFQRELDRRDKMNSQAVSFATTAGGLLALSIAALAFLRGKTFVPSDTAKGLLAAALGMYVLATALALWAAISRKYRVVTAGALKQMLTDHWTDSEVTARNIIGRLNTESVGTLRRGNEVKALLLMAAAGAQTAALALLGFALFVSLG